MRKMLPSLRSPGGHVVHNKGVQAIASAWAYQAGEPWVGRCLHCVCAEVNLRAYWQDILSPYWFCRCPAHRAHDRSAAEAGGRCGGPAGPQYRLAADPAAGRGNCQTS